MEKELSAGQELKQKNRNNIYKLIHRRGVVSKQDIVRELGLSLPTVTQNLTDLLREGLICEQGSFGNTGGRRARGYAVVPRAKVAVGVDINARRCAIVILDLHGTIIGNRREYCRFSNTDEYYKMVSNLIEELIDSCSVDRNTILGVGIATQGIMNPEKNRIVYGEILGITGTTRDTIGKYIPYPRVLLHDSDMAAFAEAWNSEDDREAVYLSCSTNLGGAIAEKDPGKMRPDRFGRARVEHMTLIPDGKKCYCGQNGCADAYCSTSVLSDYAEDGRLDTFFAELKAGDEGATELWDDYLDKLAILINNTCMMFDSDVIIGGYMGEHMEDYMDDLKNRVYKRNSFDRSRDYVRLCRVKKEPVAVGAALYYIEDFVSNI